MQRTLTRAVVAAFLAAVTLVAGFQAPASADEVYWTWQRSDLDSICIGVPDGNVANGAKVEQWPCDGSTDQSWSSIPLNPLNAQRPAWSQMHNKANPSKCVGVPNGSLAQGTELIIWTCNGVDDQLWAAFGHVGNYYLMNFNSRMVMGVGSGNPNNGARVAQWPMDAGAPDQRWV